MPDLLVKDTKRHEKAVPTPINKLPMTGLTRQLTQTQDLLVTEQKESEVATYEQSQQIEQLKKAIENAETTEAKTELEMRLAEQQILFQTELMDEMKALQMDATRLQDDISAAETEQEKETLEAQLDDKQRKLDQIRADFDKSKADFKKNLQAEAARKAERLNNRRKAAKVCKGGNAIGFECEKRRGTRDALTFALHASGQA